MGEFVNDAMLKILGLTQRTVLDARAKAEVERTRFYLIAVTRSQAREIAVQHNIQVATSTYMSWSNKKELLKQKGGIVYG